MHVCAVARPAWHLAVAIDVPIGLAEREPRVCDQAARTRLGVPRHNSVFPTPCRGTLAAADYLEACGINRCLGGRAISRQTWGIINKIASVDALLDALPGLAPRIWEAHPEVTFAELAATQRGISAPKKSAEGRRKRVELLAARGLSLDVELARPALRGLRVGRDDIVDAAACLLTAARIADGNARLLPPGPAPLDLLGRRMQIAA
jgi:predicted RNase H-like nuclease